MEAITKSPIVSITGDTSKGVSQIRAMKKEQFFTDELYKNINENLKNATYIQGLDCWFR
jgi:CRISPR/Cas system endoribonuclease Cas6 (RAMP superfamily)